MTKAKDIEDENISSKSDEMAKILAKDLLQNYKPHINKAEAAIQELISKQNNIYTDICAEKYQFSENNVHVIANMMENIKAYRNKLVKMKNQMINIHRRTNALKTKSVNIQMTKEKERRLKLRFN